MRARYFDANGDLKESGPWSDTAEIMVTAEPPEEEEGEGDEGESNNPPAKPTGINVGTTHFSVLLLWTDPGDDTITGYQVLRGDAEDSPAGAGPIPPPGDAELHSNCHRSGVD